MIREFNKDKLEEKASTIRISEGNSQPTSLVRPSSLNYKISLSEAVNDFTKKDMPTTDEQFIDVVLEEPKVSQSSGNHNTGKGNSSGNNANNEHDDFDDVMFDMTAPNVSRSTNAKGKGAQPQTPATSALNNQGKQYLDENGHQKDAWFREEEVMRRKLEKGAIN